jgi:hypothetical protein
MTDAPGRTFRLHLAHLVLDGWVTAEGQAVAIEDPSVGLTASAPTLDELVRGYGGARIEWTDPQPTHHPQEGGRT